jgi:hypothetical protein
MEVTGQIHALPVLTLKSTEQEACWATKLVRMLQRREKSLAPCRELNSNSLVIQPIA